jgi:hypothetical protein
LSDKSPAASRAFLIRLNLMKSFLPAFAFFLISALLSAQQNYPLNREFGLPLDREINKVHKASPSASEEIREKTDSTFSLPGEPSCFKPYLITRDQLPKNKTVPLLKRKLLQENLFIIRDSATQFYCTIDPMVNFEGGKDQDDPAHRTLSVNTRGFLIRGGVGKNFVFESTFFENQSYLPHYLDSFARASQVIPGQGRWKTFKQNGFDYSMSGGNISYTPNKHINVQAGTGKHFIGDGYRSLFLSDNAFNYPYLRITTTFGRFEYTNLYASLMDLTFSRAHIPAGTEHLYEKKSASFQFLSVRVTRRIQLGLFQGLICQAADSTNRQHLDAYYYNPVIGVSALHYGFGDPNHVMMGSTLKIKVCDYFTLYGQYLLDNVSQNGSGSPDNRQGFQAGAKCYDVFKIKRLHLQLEYNQVRPYTYAADNSSQSWTHYGQPLADPMGANFKEAIAILNYNVKRFHVELKWIHAQLGADSTGKNLGGNVFASDLSSYTGNTGYGLNSQSNQMLQGIKTNLDIYDVHVSYLVNPAYNLNLFAGVMMRDYRNAYTDLKTNYIYFGLRTSLTNLYYDF